MYSIFSGAIKIFRAKFSFVLRRGHAEAELKTVVSCQICPLKGREGADRQKKMSFFTHTDLACMHTHRHGQNYEVVMKIQSASLTLVSVKRIARPSNGETELPSTPTLSILLFPHTVCLFSHVGSSVSI